MSAQSRTARRVHAPRLEQLEDRIAPAGVVTVKQTGGNLTIAGDDLGNSITIDADGLAAGQLRVSPADGSTTINGSSEPLLVSGVTGSVKVSLKGGDDLLTVSAAAFPGALSVDTGKGSDSLLFGDSTTVDGAFGVKTSGALLAEINVSVAGDVRIQKAGGDNCIVTLIGAFGEDVSFTGGSSDDAFGISSATVAGAVSVVGGKGTLLTGFIDTDIAGQLKVASGGPHALSADNLSVGGATALSAGGDTAMQIADSDFSGAFSTKNGKGYDELIVNATIFGRGVSIFNGAGGSNTELSETAIGADGPAGRGVDLKVTAGAGIDTFAATGGPITVGSVSISSGAGQSIIWLEGAEVSKNLAVKGGADFDEVMVFDCIVRGKTSLDAGSGDDNLSFDGVHLVGALSVKGGAGLDDIWLDAGDDPDGPASVFDGAVSIDGGSGNDNVYVGTTGEPGNSGAYNSRLLINGGSGSDSVDILDNGNSFAFAPGYKAVENVG